MSEKIAHINVYMQKKIDCNYLKLHLLQSLCLKVSDNILEVQYLYHEFIVTFIASDRVEHFMCKMLLLLGTGRGHCRIWHIKLSNTSRDR